MDDTISRQALLESIERISVKGNVLDDDWVYRFIQEFPSAERKKGRWKADNRYHYEKMFICSKCRESVLVPTRSGLPIWDFCPNCGAYMRGNDNG